MKILDFANLEQGDTRLVRTAAITFIGVTAIVALYFGQEVLIPAAIAMLLAFILGPAVTLVRRLVPLPLAVAVVVLGALMVAGLLTVLVMTQLAEVAGSLTGYQANLGIISTLAGQGDFLLIDADSHASIYDACKMTQAEVVRFKHNDPSSLEARLRRLGDKPGNRVVGLEGIYAMLGDSAPLKEFIDVCKKYGAYVLVDEAHSLGALGDNGRGLCEAVGVLDDCHFIVGTFSKTLGAIGGYCVSDDPDFDILRVTVRAYMFTASLPPSIVASVRQALRVVKARPELRKQLWDNVATLYDGLKKQGFTLGPEHGPVVGVHLPDRMTAIGFWRAMLDAGIYVNVAVPPATPNGVSLLRCSLCAVHTREQLEHMVEVMTGIGRQFGVLPNQPTLRVAGASRVT